MKPFLPAETYRQILDVDRDEDAIIHHLPHLLSFCDWDVFDREFHLPLKQTASNSRKRPRKPSIDMPLLPLPSPSVPKSGFALLELPARLESYPEKHPPNQPISPSRHPAKSTATQVLPPLEIHILQRKRMFLNISGEPTIGIEEVVQYQEQKSASKQSSTPLQLPMLPVKCVTEDEIALMPCHSVIHRMPMLSAELWKEPIRDRDKQWIKDELSVLMALPASGKKHYSMTTVMKRVTGKWRRLEAQKLHVHPTTSIQESNENILQSSVTPTRQEENLPAQLLFKSYGVMISRTYCIVLIYGVGIYGRLYSEGLRNDPGNPRFLRVEAYDPVVCHTFTLIITLEDLEFIFQSRPECLVAGRKNQIIKELLSLLYFDYHDTCKEEEQSDTVLKSYSHELPTLCISPEPKWNEAARRRLERDERRRWEEQERMKALAKLMKLSRRARYRVLCQAVRVNGHRLILSIYHFPTQLRSFVVRVYHPPTAQLFHLAVGVMEAAAMIGVHTQPHKWSDEQKLVIARELLPKLHFHGSKLSTTTESGNGGQQDAKNEEMTSCYNNYRMALAVKSDRMGPLTPWLPAPTFQTKYIQQAQMLQKLQRDGKNSLKHESVAQMQQLQHEREIKVLELDQQLLKAEAMKAEFLVRDGELKEKIDEIDSGKAGLLTSTAIAGDIAKDSVADDKRRHEMRRAYKNARKTIKEELKALATQINGWKHEKIMVTERERLEHDKVEAHLQKKLKALETETQSYLMGIMGQWDRQQKWRKRAAGQRTWLPRCHICPDRSFLAGGVCVVMGKRWRFSLFLVEEMVTTDNRQPSIETPPSKFELVIYDPSSSRSLWIEICRLDWIALTKQRHEQQLLIPHFAIPTSTVVQRINELDKIIAIGRATLTKVKKKATKKNNKKRDQLRLEAEEFAMERKRLYALSPWRTVVNALCERITIIASSLAVESEYLSIDRYIFQTNLPIVLIANENNEEDRATSSDEASTISCDIKVIQHNETIVFEVNDPLTASHWTIPYPESSELVKEFAVETFLEQQMHLEAICMSLLFFTNATTNQLNLRFED